MAWYDDLWSGIKSVVGVAKDAASAVTPFLPLLLKKGGHIGDLKDTPANRKKIVQLYNKVHKTKLTMRQLNAHLKKKSMKK
jgi:hypothetical protein